ncbi:hypothetical protein THAOC_27559 [Thalassiosira oceanica]|uniref:Uncharacterized protein n=1 Tax=Thalassiosira oceanica TaxID=159749 RepID=K0RIL4_THAOC|nr:hypothetical protein THAOC_27559 [Thalassiosira oceanica]|eukprot:EJK53075.1 hypothetical protein THAOC_27559 [Thalassiosira oceanica]
MGQDICKNEAMENDHRRPLDNPSPAVHRHDRQARHDEQTACPVEVVAVLLPDAVHDLFGVPRPLLGARADDEEDGRRDERREGQGGQGQYDAPGRAGEGGRDPHPEEDQDPDRAEVEHVLVLGALFETLGVSAVQGLSQTSIKGNSPDLRNVQKKLRKSAAKPTRTWLQKEIMWGGYPGQTWKGKRRKAGLSQHTENKLTRPDPEYESRRALGVHLDAVAAAPLGE